jgi:hypothetical protein
MGTKKRTPKLQALVYCGRSTKRSASIGVTGENESRSIERRNMKKLTWEKFCVLGGDEKLSREGHSYVVHPMNVSTGYQALRTHTLPVFREHSDHLEWVPYTEFEMD